MAAYMTHPGKAGKVQSGWHKTSKSASEKRSRKVRRADVANARFWNR